MAIQTINIGAAPNDGTGDPLRDAFDKANDNFAELHALKAPLAAPAFTGAPTAPTAAPGTNTTQLSTTAFVQAALAALVDSSPGALDTLNELAAALGDDPNFATTVTNALAGKQPLDTDLSAIAALVSAANKIAYATGAGTWALTDFQVAAANVSHVPVLTPTTGAITSYTSACSYLRIGKLVTWDMTGTITDAGTGAGVLNASLPFNAGGPGFWVGEEHVLTSAIVKGRVSVGSNLLRISEFAAGATIIATGKGFRIGGTYIIA